MLFSKPLLNPSARKNNEKSNRHGNKNSECHTPVIEGKHNADNRNRNHIGDNLRIHMTQYMFGSGYIAHEICRKLRKVFGIKHAHRQFADVFCQSNPCIFAFHVRGYIGLFIVVFVAEKYDYCADDAESEINPHICP